MIIGSGARNTIKGGLGSGDIDSHFFITCEERLEIQDLILLIKAG